MNNTSAKYNRARLQDRFLYLPASFYCYNNFKGKMKCASRLSISPVQMVIQIKIHTIVQTLVPVIVQIRSLLRNKVALGLGLNEIGMISIRLDGKCGLGTI